MPIPGDTTADSVIWHPGEDKGRDINGIVTDAPEAPMTAFEKKEELLAHQEDVRNNPVKYYRDDSIRPDGDERMSLEDHTKTGEDEKPKEAPRPKPVKANKEFPVKEDNKDAPKANVDGDPSMSLEDSTKK